jgi:hypothetical protein
MCIYVLSHAQCHVALQSYFASSKHEHLVIFVFLSCIHMCNVGLFVCDMFVRFFGVIGR